MKVKNSIIAGDIVGGTIQQCGRNITMNRINIGSGNRIINSQIGSGYEHITSSCGGASIIGRKAIKDGKEYPFLHSMKGNSTTMINGDIFVDGYELTSKGWKKTARAFWHLLF